LLDYVRHAAAMHYILYVRFYDIQPSFCLHYRVQIQHIEGLRLTTQAIFNKNNNEFQTHHYSVP
jgi:predicted SprT family Zn-dependent metalloprotease